MSDFARYCPKCYQFFRDLDLFTKHVETCGFAKKTAEKTADSRRQTAAEDKKVRKQQAVAEAKNDGSPETADSNKEDVDNPLVSAAVCDLPSAVPAEGGSPEVKSPKFKT